MILKTKFACGTIAETNINFTSLTHEQICQHLVQYSNGGMYCLPDTRTHLELFQPTMEMQLTPEAAAALKPVEKPVDKAFDASVAKNKKLLTALAGPTSGYDDILSVDDDAAGTK